MIASNQINKPQNWQDFESLCKLLWGKIWDCSDTIMKNGRQGQNQCGVDVYAYVKKYGGYCGIQCKGKDDYSDSSLTEKEIDKVISKARDFKPKLKRLIFATTANKDAKIETYIRGKNIESINNDGFEIYLQSWEDIVEQICKYQEVRNWYVNNCQYIDSTRVDVTLNGKDSITIHPQYVKTITKHILKRISTINDSNYNPFTLNYPLFDISQQFNKTQEIINSIKYTNDILNGKCKYDKRWCTIEFEILNSGDTVIRNMKMYIGFKSETVEKISDKFHYLDDWRIDPAIIAHENSRRDASRELFQKHQNIIEYRSNSVVFVQGDKTHFKIGLLPANGVTAIPVYWRFLSEDYSKTGELTIKVEPYYEEVIKTTEVDNPEDLKDDEIIIEPKITIE